MFRQLKTNEVALLLHALRAVSVMSLSEEHAKLTRLLEGELASRGVTLRTEEELRSGMKLTG